MLHFARRLLVAGLLLGSAPLHAQGGPPMQNDDPSTVPDGHFEINLSASGSGSGVAREIEWLRVDANYGYGERTQLKFETPVTAHTGAGDSTHTGLGASTAGVRFRFLDQDKAGVDASVYPQYTFDVLHVSSKHGVTSGDGEFFLPLEIARDFGAFKLGGEFGHDFVESAPDEFVWGIVGGTDCIKGVECLAEVRSHRVAGESLTLVNAGARVKINEAFNLLLSAGHGVGPDSPDRPDWVFYVALQVLK